MSQIDFRHLGGECSYGRGMPYYLLDLEATGIKRTVPAYESVGVEADIEKAGSDGTLLVATWKTVPLWLPSIPAGPWLCHVDAILEQTNGTSTAKMYAVFYAVDDEDAETLIGTTTKVNLTGARATYDMTMLHGVIAGLAATSHIRMKLYVLAAGWDEETLVTAYVEGDTESRFTIPPAIPLIIDGGSLAWDYTDYAPCTVIRHHRGTALAWAGENLVLAEGEIGLETTTPGIKIGDGVTAWNSLAWYLFKPALHASAHAVGQADVITPGAIGAVAASTGTAAGDRLRWTAGGTVERQPCLVDLGTAGAGSFAPTLKDGAHHTVTRTGIWTGITPSGLEIGEGCTGTITGAFATATTGVIADKAGDLDDIAAASVGWVIWREASGHRMVCWEKA